MNENLNLREILKYCPKGTELYSPLYGDVYFQYILYSNTDFPIVVNDIMGYPHQFRNDGKFFSKYNEGECLLFPSKENRDWATFKVPVKRMKVTDFKPFDKILCRDSDTLDWLCSLFSHPVIEEEEKYTFVVTTDGCYYMAIPFNEETEHLVGTAKDCPDYYKWWEK